MYHTELKAWKYAMELVKKIYILTRNFPDDERFGLVIQLRRAAVSVPSNIAEGSARHSDKEQIRFIDIALGSLAELETQLLISKELNYTNDVNDVLDLLKNVNALTMGLRGHLAK